MNSKLLGRKTEKHKIQVLSCDGELKAEIEISDIKMAG